MIGGFMSYDRRQVFIRVESLLASAPRTSLASLARHVGVSRHTLEAIMRQVTGKTFREYQKQIVLQKTLHLVTTEGTLSQRAIAATVGYRSPEAFCRFFKRTTGTTLRQIKRRQAMHPFWRQG